MRAPSASLICSAGGARTDNAIGRLSRRRLEGIPVLRDAVRCA